MSRETDTMSFTLSSPSDILAGAGIPMEQSSSPGSPRTRRLSDLPAKVTTTFPWSSTPSRLII